MQFLRVVKKVSSWQISVYRERRNVSADILVSPADEFEKEDLKLKKPALWLETRPSIPTLQNCSGGQSTAKNK